jgi:hypothetical protein
VLTFITPQTGTVQIVGARRPRRTSHIEGIANGFHYNSTGGLGYTYITGITGGNGVTNLVLRQTGSAANQCKAGMLNPNGATNTINNAGTMTAGFVAADTVF